MAPEDYQNVEKLGEDEIWKINEKILDDAIKSGKRIKLTHDPDKYKNDKSFYAKEIRHLKKKGYKFTDYENGVCYAY